MIFTYLFQPSYEMPGGLLFVSMCGRVVVTCGSVIGQETGKVRVRSGRGALLSRKREELDSKCRVLKKKVSERKSLEKSEGCCKVEGRNKFSSQCKWRGVFGGEEAGDEEDMEGIYRNPRTEKIRTLDPAQSILQLPSFANCLLVS